MSCNTYLQAMNAFGKWLHEEGHVKERVRPPLLRTEKRIIGTLTEKERRTLLTFKPKGFRQWRIHALVCTILDTGCRIDELLSARESDFDFDNPLLTVVGKGRKEPTIPFGFELRKVLFRDVQFRNRYVFSPGIVRAIQRTHATQGGQVEWLATFILAIFILFLVAGIARKG